MSDDTTILRRMMREMVALSALPAAWVDLEPLQIAEGLAEVVQTTLRLDLVYLRSAGPDERFIELARAPQGPRSDAVKIGKALAPILEFRAADSALTLANPIGEGVVRCICMPIRWETREWILVACSKRPEFPAIEDRLVLGVSTNHAAAMLARNYAELSLRKSESRYGSVIAAMQEGIVLLAADGSIQSCNPAAQRILGMTEDEMKGSTLPDPLWRAVHEDGTPFPSEAFPALITLRTGQPCSNVVMGLQKRDGQLAWISTNTEPLFHDGEPQLVGVVASFVDISERKRTDEALRASDHRWRSLTEALPQLVWTCLPDGTFEYLSPQWREFTGMLESDIAARGWIYLLPADERERNVANWLAALQRGRDFAFDHRMRRADGTYRWFHTSARPMRDDSGMVIKWLGTSTDVSELREAREAAESANRAKDEFLANVSHEIRTPMNAILGMTELTLDSELGSEQRDWLRTVKSAGENLLGIIDSLLDFAKMSANALELERAELSLREELADILRALAVRAHRKGLELIGDIDDDVPDRLTGDAGRLRQVLINLVGNAIKFTDQGEVVVRVEAQEHSGDDVVLRFIVRDSGIGIPADKHALIFEAFKQEDTSTTRKYGGTGLGLTIASRIAALMQGSISVASGPGKGSTFTFTARLGRGGTPDRPTPAPAPGTRILVVDDNRTSRETLERWLRSWQLDVTAVADGLAAMDALWDGVAAGRPYRVAMLDATIPGVDGTAIAARVRTRFDGVKIAMMISGGRSEDEARARHADVSVRKPLLKNELAAVLVPLLDARALEHRPADTPPRASSAPSAPPGAARMPMRVLVAEDNDFNAQLVRELLRRRGHHPRVVATGNEVLARLEEEQFDLLLLDLHMPGLDGFQVIERIRVRERTAGGHLPVIALTARSRNEDRDRCLAAGMDGFLVKPIDRNALWSEVERVAPGDEWIDASVLLAACGADAEILDALKNAVREHLPEALARVGAAFRCRDPRALREAAHSLHGMIATVSGPAGSAASAIEDAAAEGALERASEPLDQLEALSDVILARIGGVTLERLELLVQRQTRATGSDVSSHESLQS